MLTVVGAVLYVAFLVTAPFAHHDLACHFKSPLHCTSCTSSVVGSDPQAPTALGSARLVDAGLAVVVQVRVGEFLLAVRSTGRSPPSRS